MKSNNNNLMCDLETDICGGFDKVNMETYSFESSKKRIHLYYVTDPICSHCWAFEPVLRRFLAQYGDYFQFHTIMGGLLDKWGDGPIDPANGIFKPADVAPHWREVGELSRMPIDGSLMINNPVESSYPPSRVFKVIQKKYNDATGYEYLRSIREALFVFNQNISDKSVLIDLVNKLNLDGKAIVSEAEEATGQELLNEDFQLSNSLGVRGFPTIVMINDKNEDIKIFGSRSFQDYVNGLKQVLGKDELQPKQLPPLSSLIEKEKLLFFKELEIMYDIEQADVNKFINEELPLDNYHVKEILGESYITTKE